MGAYSANATDNNCFKYSYFHTLLLFSLLFTLVVISIKAAQIIIPQHLIHSTQLGHRLSLVVYRMKHTHHGLDLNEDVYETSYLYSLRDCPRS